MANEETATCPSCSLIVRVIYDPVSIQTTDTVLTIISCCVFQEMFALADEEITLEDSLKKLAIAGGDAE